MEREKHLQTGGAPNMRRTGSSLKCLTRLTYHDPIDPPSHGASSPICWVPG